MSRAKLTFCFSTEEPAKFIELLTELSTSETLRGVISESILRKICDIEKDCAFDPTNIQAKGRPKRLKSSHHPSRHSKGMATIVEIPKESGVERMEVSVPDDDDDDDPDELEQPTVLSYLMEYAAKYEFPSKLVTFLLQLLPDDEYKVSI